VPSNIEIRTLEQPAERIESPLLVVPLFQSDSDEGCRFPDDFAEAWQYAADDGFRAKKGESSVAPGGGTAAKRIAWVGLGKREDFEIPALRGAITAAAGLARQRKLESFTIALHDVADAHLSPVCQRAGEAAVYAGYEFDHHRSGSDDDPETRLSSVTIAAAEVDTDAVERGRILGEAVCSARDWVAEPPNVCTPSYLARQAEAIAEESGLTLQLIEGQEAIEAEKMGLFAAVGRGSVEPSVLIHLTYRSADADSVESLRRIAFVGKGVTFDSGGYSLKPPASQVGMHGDMGGAAAVLGAARAVGNLAPRGCELHFIVPSAENLVAGNAYRVNDVITGRNGKTVEVANTDAEGRLLLADALAYANELEVDTLVDVATLTGGCVVALGGVHAGVMSNDQATADRFMAAGEAAGELFWQLPLTERLRKKLESSSADIKNSGGRWGSAITAALFLSNFVDDTNWVHIDMAGLEMYEAAWEHMPRGATGFGVLALAEFACWA